MKRSLSIPKGAKQQLYFAYLNGEIRKRAVTSITTYNYAPDGRVFTTNIQTVFSEAFGQLNLLWVFATSPTGELVSVEVFPSIEARQADWECSVREILDAALQSAFVESRTPTFRRQLLYYIGPRLDGEYWLKGGIRLAPPPLDDPWPGLVNAERIAVLDFEVKSIDDQDANYLASEFSRRWAARLSLILDVDLYEQVGEHVWVHDTDESSNLRFCRGVRDLPTPTSMPKKGADCKLGEKGPPLSMYVINGPLRPPSEIRKILRGLDDLPKPVQDAFDGAARMYQIGLSLVRRFPSAALAYRVAATEALAKIDPDCNKSASAFTRKYSPRVSEELLNFLYGDIRSSHFHEGKFRLGEFLVQRNMEHVPVDPDGQLLSRRRYECFMATREALVNWMLSIADSESS
jgi:hypothetical protein